jgi:hypothetical protein
MRFLAVAVVVCLNVSAPGAIQPEGPVEWPVAAGGNGHFYQVVQGGSGRWTDANDNADSHSFQGVSGHLATVTSEPERAFLTDLTSAPDADASARYWIGGIQTSGATTPADGWSWVTGEPWAFTAWGPNEPNDRSVFVENGVEQYLMMFAGKNPPDFGVRGMWNDESNVPFGPIGGYLVEYDLPEPHPAALLAGAMALPLLRRRRAALRR